MTKLKLHYGGWLTLPTTLINRLGVDAGDQLDTEWTDGGLMLKAKGGDRKAAEPKRDEPEFKSEIVGKAEKPEPKPVKTAKAKRKTPAKPSTRSTGKLAAKILPKARGRKT